MWAKAAGRVPPIQRVSHDDQARSIRWGIITTTTNGRSRIANRWRRSVTRPRILRSSRRGWLSVSALLGIIAARWDSSGGIWGASRHALTVGFVSVMVLSVGQRILPAFAAMRLLWSTRLMFASLALLTTGCTLRVVCEVLAYQGYAAWAWSVLPVSAILELAGLTAFAVNIFGTFLFEPSHVQKQPLMVGLPVSNLDRR